MFKLTLPTMVGGRKLPNTYVDRFAGDLRDAEVLIDAHRLTNSSPSFAAEIVHRLLVRESVGTMRLVGAPVRFAEYVREAADRLGVTDHLQISDSTRQEVRLLPLSPDVATSRAR